jgi:hypothetical protein
MGRTKIPIQGHPKKGNKMLYEIAVFVFLCMGIAGVIAAVIVAFEDNGVLYNDEDESLVECHRCGEWYLTEEFGGSGTCPYCPKSKGKYHHNHK